MPAGGSGEFHVRVRHGCGELPTDTLEVQLDGIVSAQPAYVPGWDVEVEMVESEPYERFGETLTERVGVIRWSGGQLPNHAYFDFGILATFLLDAGTVVPIPVVQRCGDAESAWIETPADGLPSGVQAVTLDLRHQLTAGAALSAEAEASADAWEATAVLPLEGPWEVTLVVRVDTFIEERGSCRISIVG